MRRFVALAPIALAASIAVAPGAALSTDAGGEALARQFYAAFNARDLSALEGIVAPDLIDHTGDADGLDGMRDELEGLVDEMLDARITIELSVVSGDYVTVVSNIRGTTGGMMPADQRILNYPLIDVWLIRDGMLAEVWRAEAD